MQIRLDTTSQSGSLSFIHASKTNTRINGYVNLSRRSHSASVVCSDL